MFISMVSNMRLRRQKFILLGILVLISLLMHRLFEMIRRRSTTSSNVKSFEDVTELFFDEMRPMNSPTPNQKFFRRRVDDVNQIWKTVELKADRVTSRYTRVLTRKATNRHFPGIRISPHYRLVQQLSQFNVTVPDQFVDADAWVDQELQDVRFENAFYFAVEIIQVTCDNVRRLGNVGDGGWNVCLSDPFTLDRNNCIIYSFGINNDFSFDDAGSRDFGCQVFAFDPSMSVDDYIRPSGVHFFQLGLGSENTVSESGWKLMTLNTIRRKLQHSHKIIDLLKIDIDYSEWQCLTEIISAGSLRDIRQVVLEIHTPEVLHQSSTKHHFRQMWSTLIDLELAGFRRFFVLPNPSGNYTSPRSGQQRACCYDLSYINIRFLEK